MHFAIIFIAALSAAVASPSHPDVEAWNQFKLAHNKVYDAQEERLRFQIFSENLKKIEEHNAEYEAGKTTYLKGVNQFTDMTEEEFIQYLTLSGPKPNITSESLGEHKAPIGVELPSSVDYRNKKAVNPIKNQRSCGSCWAFSTTGSLESINFIKRKKLLSLSEQNLVDCSRKYGNNGCRGGSMQAAFNYIRDNGLQSESSYPYKAVDGSCKFSKSKSVISVKGFRGVQRKSEAALQSAVASVGPVSVAVDATEFQSYRSGIFKARRRQVSLNHGVVVVGYGSQNGQAYWIVRNSWGTAWGEKGYIRVARNAGNQVGITDDACYPVL